MRGVRDEFLELMGHEMIGYGPSRGVAVGGWSFVRWW